jgi:uncharacterized protein YozE (UPF0346 family)
VSQNTSQSASPFVLWLLQQKSRNNGDEVGRLAREAQKDKTFPRTTNRLWIFLHYYNLEPRNREAIKIAHAEWRRFRELTRNQS